MLKQALAVVGLSLSFFSHSEQIIQNGFTLELEESGYARNRTVLNAYGVLIEDRYYDMSFNNSFGNPLLFSGDKLLAEQAAFSSLRVIGSITDSHSGWRVMYSEADYFQYGCAAGCFYMYDSAIEGETYSGGITVQFRVSEIPIPAAAWLFGSALIGLVGIKRRK
ncbi:VPLPA-CTERM sorting domain-containing protein [Oceanicoccus sagamiensis]|uniref:PEP-CTERM protein-sorting domain-containing protein n=1 Tax=Oceanicoccus sagamiensis TaxID=716816 RepID=A0A1X9NA50_9GAMM|nr:VPLPA-CTERM sorting domain-containing protein [Oceanicoccus sagamiensis]ARN73312.1 hypothetical protein BST96_03845 [Oceanicoccus sagamiensis]